MIHALVRSAYAMYVPCIGRAGSSRLPDQSLVLGSGAESPSCRDASSRVYEHVDVVYPLLYRPDSGRQLL